VPQFNLGAEACAKFSIMHQEKVRLMHHNFVLSQCVTVLCILQVYTKEWEIATEKLRQQIQNADSYIKSFQNGPML